MPSEDHPKFAEWQAASYNFKLAKAAQGRGEGSMLDISSALLALNRVSDEINGSSATPETIYKTNK